MINLLPPTYRTDMLYARRNTQMVRWTMAACVSLLITLVILAGGYFLLQQSVKSETKNVATAKAELQSLKLDETQKQVEEISSNTKLVTQVLSREILFSKLLKQLGASLPSNTALLSFQVDKLQGGLSLKAGAQDVQSATQLQVNLQDPQNKIFEKADIESITCAKPDAETVYPCTVQIRALFLKDNPYSYLNSAKTVKQ